VRFDRYFEDKDNVYLMLDICHNQSLSDLIKRRKRLHEVEARFYLNQLVKGMQYVHSMKVIHRDLKLGNLFLTERMNLKIGDFGLAAQVAFEGERKKTVCGTPNYLAPEVLFDNSAIGGGHSYEVDCWSIGVILYTMLCGRPPFESPDVKQTY
jgi:polo-like kinase 1